MTALRFHLRPGRPKDLDAVVALDRITDLAPHWPVKVYKTILGASPGDLKSSRRCLIIAERTVEDGEIESGPLVGFAVGLVHPAPVSREAVSHLAELEDVVVAADCRRSGVGRALCVAVLGWCHLQGATEAILEVRAANAAAIAVYQQLDFRKIGYRPRYYRDPDDDAIAMSLRPIKAAF